jgi:hypothetical protein
LGLPKGRWAAMLSGLNKMLIRRGILLGAISFALALSPAARAQNLLVNGGFTNPVIPGSQDFLLGTNQLTGWTVSAGNISLQSVAYATTFTQITQANQTPTGFPANPSQEIDLTGASASGGMIMQDISSALSGQTYHFSIDNYRYGNFSGLAFQVSIFNIAIPGSPVLIASQTFATPQGVLTNVGFNFVATNANIRVVIQDISGSDTNAGWVDNASIVLVPETATWGAIGGVFALGLMWRRWRAARATASGPFAAV